MYVAHVKIVMEPGKGHVWEAWKRAEGELMRGAPGWIKRILLRSKERPDTFYYISFWETIEQATAFAQAPEFAAAGARFRDEMTFVEFDRDDSELVLDEIATGLDA